MKTTLSSLFLTSALIAPVVSAASAPSFQSPNAWEPNVGQALRDTQFVGRGSGYTVELRRCGPRLTMQDGHASARLDLTLSGVNPSAQWQGQNELPGKANYFLGRDQSSWKTNIPTFGAVREDGIYPGIDLVYYGHAKQVEYDFIVKPGANPGLIRMHFSGNQAIRINDAGDLVLSTAAGDVIEHKPLAYQTIAGMQRRVESSFVLDRNANVSFRLGAFDRSAALVIDPVLAYSTYIGGAGAEQANAIAVDGAGSIYVVGSTNSSGSGGNDVLLRKFASNGTQVFMADLGGSGDDFGYGVKVGTDGSVFVSGQTASSNFPVASAAQTQLAGSANAFVMRVNANGQGLIFSTYLGGNATEVSYGIALDGQNAAYVTGTSTSSNFPSTQGVIAPTNRGGKDALVAKYSATGAVVFATLLGGKSDDEGRGIAVDGTGNVYVTGSTQSSDFPMVNNPYQHSLHGNTNAFVAEMNPQAANFVYSTIFGGSLGDSAYGIAVDANGSAYIAGKAGSLDFPTTTGAYNTSYNGGDNDIFVAKFTSGQAGLVYSTLLGTHGNDEGFAIAIDSAGDAYVTGDTDSDQFPVTSGAVQTTRKGNRDIVVTELDPNGASLVFSTYLGGSLNDIGYGIALDTSNNVYFAGVTSSTDFPIAGAASQPASGGSGNPDAFVSAIFFAGTGTAPTISTGGVVNSANFAAGAVAPGSVVSIFGTNFSAQPINAGSIPLGTTLAGVTVTVNGTAAPLYYVGPLQINFQMPVEAAPGPATVVVTTPAGNVSASVTIAAIAPWLIIANNQSAILNQDGTLNTPSNPAHAGSFPSAYFVGIGPVNVAITDGAASPLAISTQAYSATIGGTAATVTYMGLSPGSVGLAQCNLQVPTGLGTADLPLVITIGGVASNSATISVAP